MVKQNENESLFNALQFTFLHSFYLINKIQPTLDW